MRIPVFLTVVVGTVLLSAGSALAAPPAILTAGQVSQDPTTAGLASADAGDGTAQRSWISETSGGPAASTFHVASLQRLYANFTWATPPAPGQKLEIQWQGPTGELRAIWVNRTVSSDSPGTRIFAWISAAKLKQAPGTWRVLLVVGGVTRSTRAFRATTGISLRDRLVRAAIAETPAQWRGKTRYTLHLGKRFPNYASVYVYPAPGYSAVVQQAIMLFKRSGDDWKSITTGGEFSCGELPHGAFPDIRVGCLS